MQIIWKHYPHVLRGNRDLLSFKSIIIIIWKHYPQVLRDNWDLLSFENIIVIIWKHYPQVVWDNQELQDNLSSSPGNRYKVSEFVTVKVQGIFLTCIHSPNPNEQAKIDILKRIWAEQEKKGLW